MPGHPQRPVAVVGAGGFLGRALTAGLRRTGRPAVAFTRAVPFLAADGGPAPGLATAGTVYWLATQINPQLAEQEPDRVVRDRAAFEDLLRAVQGVAPAPTVVLLSSGGTVYDPAGDPPYDEQAPTRPMSAYGRAKLELEGLLAAAAPGRHVVLRTSNAYGPGQPAVSGQGVVSHWLRAARRGEPVRVFGDPATTRDYVFVEDVVAAMLAVLDAPADLPPVINVGSGQPTTLRELAETVLDVVADPGLDLVVEPARSFDVPRTWLDVRRAEQVLGWRPVTTLRDGVAAAWESLRHSAPA